jgi:hypothetical protein
MSRPKLTDEITDKIANLVRAGHYLKTAARAAGISEATFHVWKARGAAAKSGPYRAFHDAIEQAEAESELILVQTVLEAGPKGALEVLKRRFPEHWGDRHRFEHSGPNGGPLKTENEHSGGLGPPVTIVLAGGGTWDPGTHGDVQDATEEDLPDAEV